jgi:hypothetical protein
MLSRVVPAQGGPRRAARGERRERAWAMTIPGRRCTGPWARRRAGHKPGIGGARARCSSSGCSTELSAERSRACSTCQRSEATGMIFGCPRKLVPCGVIATGVRRDNRGRRHYPRRWDDGVGVATGRRCLAWGALAPGAHLFVAAGLGRKGCRGGSWPAALFPGTCGMGSTAGSATSGTSARPRPPRTPEPGGVTAARGGLRAARAWSR